MAQALPKLKKLLPFLTLPIILFMAFGLINIAGFPTVQHIYGERGVYDMRGFDFENYVAITRQYVEYVPNALLTPDEFAAWEGEISIGWGSGYTHATSRMLLYVEDGRWYTFYRYSIDYSHRLFVNGEWLLDIGRPGATPETDVPDTGIIIFTAQGINGVIEIVQQSSNHVHRHGGGHPWWYIGTVASVSDWVRAEQYQVSLVMGSFLIMALLFLVLYFTHGQNPATLYFALFCITWFMRAGVTGGKVFTVIFPWMDWHSKFRIEYIAIPMSAILTLAIVNALFKNILHKPVLYALYGVSAVFIALFLFLPTIQMRDVLDYVFIVYAFAIVWLVGCIAYRQIFRWWRFKQNPFKTEQIIFFVGLLLFLIAAFTDFGYFTAILYMPPFQLTGVAMLVFALCEAAAVFFTTMKEVEKAKDDMRKSKEKERETAAEKAALESLNRLRNEYLSNISHETKTPLTAISVNIQLAAALYEKAGGVEGENGKIIDSALRQAHDDLLRVARMSSDALWFATIQDSHKHRQPLNMTDFIPKSAETYRSFIEKRGNTFIVSVSENLPVVFAGADQLVQVILNLLTNSNNHTKNGLITLDASYDSGFVKVIIKDTGTGIKPELLPHVFERGVTGADGSGLGLSISKDIIEAHEGTIAIESEWGEGTTVTFLLPEHCEHISEGNV